MEKPGSVAVTANDWFFDLWEGPLDTLSTPPEDPIMTAWRAEQTELRAGLLTCKPELIWMTERLRYELGEAHDSNT